MMTPRFVSGLATALLMLCGCSNSDQAGLTGGPAAGAGGTSGTTTGDETAGGVAPDATGGTRSQSTGGTAGPDEPQGGAGGTTVIQTAVPERCSEASTGEVSLTHVPSTGQPNSLVGATKMTAGTVASFSASDLALKLCFSVVGTSTLTEVTGLSIDSASINGGNVNYVNLAGTTLSLEAASEPNRYCIVFDVGSAAGAEGIEVSGETAVTYNWRFDKKSIDVSVMFDPRAKNAPELKAVLGGNVSACQVLGS